MWSFPGGKTLFSVEKLQMLQFTLAIAWCTPRGTHRRPIKSDKIKRRSWSTDRNYFSEVTGNKVLFLFGHMQLKACEKGIPGSLVGWQRKLSTHQLNFLSLLRLSLLEMWDLEDRGKLHWSHHFPGESSRRKIHWHLVAEVHLMV